MGYFAVRVIGRGFEVPLSDGERRAKGFYLTVFVEADDEFDACDKGLRVVVEDPDFDAQIGAYADPDSAEVFSDYWYELASFDGCETPRTPYIFYEDEAEVPAPAPH